MKMNLSFIKLEELDDTISLITLNRPEVRNALNRPLLLELTSVMDYLKQLQRKRAIIITGGENFFCAGADLKERLDFTQEDVKKYIYLIRDTFTQIENLPYPVIAAINGYALGGGMELALACDLRVTDEHAVFGLMETSLGIIPGAGGTQRLPRIVGIAKAKELIFLAKKISGLEAKEIGLVNKLVQNTSVVDAAYQMAKQIAQHAPLAITQSKFVLHQGLGIEEGLQLETIAYERLIATKDRIEGLKAFAEKRTPRFIGV
jgi:enoyl-CoA hydratase/carnithine racemase